MALTIRLSKEEQGLLRTVQTYSGTKTASATIKYMIKHHQDRLDMINGLEKQLQAALSHSHELDAKLSNFGEAWHTLEMIANDSTRVDPERRF